MFRIFCLFLTLLICVSLFADTSVNISTIPHEITNGDEAIAAAVKYTGFGNLKGFKSSSKAKVDVITYKDESLPFLSEAVEGKRVWRIVFNDVLILSDRYDEETKCNRKVYVYIDSTSGTLIRIYSPYSGNNNELLPTRMLDIPEEELAMNEVLTGFVENDTVVSFYGCMMSKSVRAFQCNEYEAYLVNRINKNISGAKPIPVWIIIDRGKIEIPEKLDEKEKRLFRNNFYRRRLIDAKTGIQAMVMSISGPDKSIEGNKRMKEETSE